MHSQLDLIQALQQKTLHFVFMTVGVSTQSGPLWLTSASALHGIFDVVFLEEGTTTMLSEGLHIPVYLKRQDEDDTQGRIVIAGDNKQLPGYMQTSFKMPSTSAACARLDNTIELTGIDLT